MFSELVDIKEENIKNFDLELLEILISDKTTNKSIVWGTDIYEENGVGFREKDNIKIHNITGVYKNIIRPRTKKSKLEKEKRIKSKAEVFTPSWICNKQNNLIDNEWFEVKNVFNKEIKDGWRTTKKKIRFPKGKTWIDYIGLLRIEITCGEAPYLVNRYDSVTGEVIDLNNRIGMLDRKFRVLNENCSDYDEWIKHSITIIKSIYGFDWQGDNVLLARENILYTYTDNYKYMFKHKPSADLVKEIANIISWNVWQMDGINYIIPYSCKNDSTIQYTIFGTEERLYECIGCKKNNIYKHNGIYAKIMNWETNRTNKFINIVKRSRKK